MPMIEEYWFMQDHKDLRAAATELYLNLLHTKEVGVAFYFWIMGNEVLNFSGTRVRNDADY